MRHCRYRGQPKAHLQHVLTAVAVNIERLSRLPPGESTAPRPPTAFQDYPRPARHQTPALMASRQLSHSNHVSRQSQAESLQQKYNELNEQRECKE